MLKLFNLLLNLTAVCFLTYGMTNLVNDFFVSHRHIDMQDAFFVAIPVFKFVFMRLNV